MNWKEFFKHGLILYGITLIFGVIWILPGRVITTVLPTGPVLPLSLLWIPVIIILILIPFVYSLIIKKTIKDCIIISFLFVLLSSIISLPLLAVLRNVIINSEGNPVVIFIRDIFNTNPQSVIANAICVPYYIKGLLDCPIDYFGTFIGIILLSLIAFVIISVSMILRNIPSILKK
jgi:hypothetical protein